MGYTVDTMPKKVDPTSEFGRRLLKLRTERGLTQAQLAEALNTKQSAIARLESGSHRPSLATLDKVCGALDAHLEVRLVPG